MSRSKSKKQDAEMEERAKGLNPEWYIVRTGLFLKNPLKWKGAKGATWELVFCSSGGCWLLPAEAARAKSAKCRACYYDGDLLHRGGCETRVQTHEVISLEEAHARALLNPNANRDVSLPTAELFRACGLHVTKDWRVA
jgi:hypothetical protein